MRWKCGWDGLWVGVLRWDEEKRWDGRGGINERGRVGGRRGGKEAHEACTETGKYVRAFVSWTRGLTFVLVRSFAMNKKPKKKKKKNEKKNKITIRSRGIKSKVRRGKEKRKNYYYVRR